MSGKDTARDDRLAAALRDNLRRRKAAARKGADKSKAELKADSPAAKGATDS